MATTMSTKRTPVRPPGGKRIRLAAVAAFREMQRLEESCDDCQYNCRDGDCQNWDQANDILRDETKFYPWDWPTCRERLSRDGRDADAVMRYRMLKAAADEAALEEAKRKGAAWPCVTLTSACMSVKRKPCSSR